MRAVTTLLIAVALVGYGLAAQAQGPALDPELEAGIRQVDEGNFEAGIAKLDQVAKKLKASGAAPLQLSRAYLYLGIAHLQLSQEQAARARFAEAVRADKNLKLSEYEFPPPVIKVFEEAKKGAEAEAAGPGPVKHAKLPFGPFVSAVKSGDFNNTRRMLSEDPDLATARDEEFGATALHWAALRGQAALAGLLVASGADVNARNDAGETPAQVAKRANRPEIADLLQRPASAAATTAPTAAPRSPAPTAAPRSPAPTTAPRSTAPAAAAAVSGPSIFDAAKTGNVDRIRELLDGAPGLASVRDTAFGATPLHWAALRGHVEAIRLLVEKGADVSVVNNDGETPLDVARRAKRTEAVRLLEEKSRSTKDRFFEAVRQGDAVAVAALLQDDPRLVKQRDAAFGASGLHWAALRGHAAVARLLLAGGADPAARNDSGETPLDVANRAKRADVAALLSAAR